MDKPAHPVDVTIDFERSVYCFGILSGAVRQPFCRAAGWRKQQHAFVSAGQNVDDAFDDRRLSSARAASYHRHSVVHRTFNCTLLVGVKYDLVALFKRLDL